MCIAHKFIKRTDTKRYVGKRHGCSRLLVVGRNVSVVVVGDGQRPWLAVAVIVAPIAGSGRGYGPQVENS